MQQKIPALKGPCGDALRKHYKTIASLHLRDMFAADANRFEKFSIEACDLLLDYSKNKILPETIALLVDLAEQSDIKQWRDKLFEGEPINVSEHRSATHVQFRVPNKQGGYDYTGEHGETLLRMRQISEALRRGEQTGCNDKIIRDVVCLGIGGSHLGCAMCCQAIDARDSAVRIHFVAAAGAGELEGKLKSLDPNHTLFIITSKSFANWETQTNAQLAKQWISDTHSEITKHFIAVSANEKAAREFGIAPENFFWIPRSIGGRYSLSSAAGLPFAVHAGMDAFESFLHGAYRMDEHFRNTSTQSNMPIIMSLLDIWYTNFCAVQSRAVLSYVRCLELLPSYLQQLEMESNGKMVSKQDQPIDYHTSPVLWGSTALEGQHSFSQLLHQGTHLIPIDFIVSCQQKDDDSDAQVCSNFFSQSHLLMEGMESPSPHLMYPGNRPSTTLMMQKLTPSILGTLIALYEHKVFCNATIWDINPFDQWGVAAGKELSKKLLPVLQKKDQIDFLDPSTHALIKKYYQWH